MLNSFHFAFRGLWTTIKSERNMRVHLCFAFYVVIAGFITKISEGEWCSVLLCIGTVTALECLNTALENLCDALCPEKSTGIKHAKDAAAGAVLCAAIVSAAVGCAVFLDEAKLALAYAFLTEHPICFGILALSLIPAIIFVKAVRENIK